MQLEKEQLSEISKLSSLLISPLDIAIFLQLNEKDFMYEIVTRGSEIHNAFRSGYLKTLIVNRENLLKSAESSAESNLEIQRLLEEYEAVIKSDTNTHA